MNCIALSTSRSDVSAHALENPMQVAAHDYERRYGSMAPRFSRAMAVTVGDNLIVLVSGTASIERSATMHVGDVVKQTELTLNIIEALLSPANLAHHGAPDASVTLDSIIAARVYLKRIEDFAACRAVCEKRFANVPVVYVNADVCRPDLLVEIEAISITPISARQRAVINPDH